MNEIKHLAKLIEDSSYLSIYNTSNRILYKMFEDYPENKIAEHIVAKVLILGRTYAAAIERRKTGDKLSNDEFYIQEVPRAFQSADIDKGLLEVKNTTGELEKAAKSLYLHGRFQACINPITGLDKRSLCSKYLHFQLPEAFYIYDTRAVKAIRYFKKLLPQMKAHGKQFPKYQMDWDKDYYSFCKACYCLDKVIDDALGKNLSKRELDSLLIASVR